MKLLIMIIVLPYSFAIFGQNENRIYFSDSLFCMYEYNNRDTLWNIVKDGFTMDSIFSWSFGTITKSKDTLNLNCFLKYDRNKEEYKCDEYLWSKKISMNAFYEKTNIANLHGDTNMLSELTTRFVIDFYRLINKKEHNYLTLQDRNETVRAYKCLDLFLNYFPNDSLRFIRRIVSYLDSSQVDFYKRASQNFKNKNYGEALFYSKIYPYLQDSINYDKKYEINEIYEISMIHYLDLQHIYAYFNQYNYVLLDKFKQSKKLFPKTKRYSEVWWNK